MSWVEVFAVLVVSHLVGDFVLQTEWQAVHKHGGLGPNQESRSALGSHVATYLGAFVPALIWIAGHDGLGVALGVAVLILLPHAVLDDGRLLTVYVRRVKKVSGDAAQTVYLGADQTLHVVALLLIALLIGS